MVTDVEATIEGDDRHFRITAVDLKYRLKVPAGKRAEADRALEIHEKYCPVHQSIKRGFHVRWSALIDEV